ncbi:MAG: hypothetical protein KGL39_13140 [Patescibacteria group bacterium]|nr:hypothetical protein [Patescibacteria group bacterium]
MTLATSALTATATTSPFATAPQSGVELIKAGPIITMSWSAISAANTSGQGADTWTYTNLIPSSTPGAVNFRPATTQVGVILVQNDQGPTNAFAGTCQVDTNGTVTFTPSTTSTPGASGQWGRAGNISSIFGFTMAWKSQ